MHGNMWNIPFLKIKTFEKPRKPYPTKTTVKGLCNMFCMDWSYSRNIWLSEAKVYLNIFSVFIIDMKCQCSVMMLCVLILLYSYHSYYKDIIAINHFCQSRLLGVERNSVVEYPLLVYQIAGLSPLVDPLNYFSLWPVHHSYCSKGRGMCYPVCGMVYIKDHLLLIGMNCP